MNRPVVLTVFGILNLVFAAWGVCGGLFGAAVFLVPQGAGARNPVLEIMHANPGFMAFQKLTILLGLVAAIVLAVAGIGLLMVKPWGRSLSIGYAIYAIVMAIVGTAASYVWLVAPLMERAGRGAEQAAAVGGAVGGLLGGCFALIYPVILLIFMFRPNVVAAMQPQDPYAQPPFMPPRDYPPQV
jgi:hypothetical protein